jgi:hypothetical protein
MTSGKPNTRRRAPTGALWAGFAPLPTVVLTYQWYRDNPACPDVIANRKEND